MYIYSVIKIPSVIIITYLDVLHVWVMPKNNFFKEKIVASWYLIKNLTIWCLEIPAATYKYLQGFQLKSEPLTKQ